MRNAKHICDGRTYHNMRLMVHRGHGIPFTWPDEGGKPLRGELYEINEEDLMPIHGMEVSAGYEAKWRPIVLDNGENTRALVYIYPPTENQFFMNVPQCDYSVFRLRS